MKVQFELSECFDIEPGVFSSENGDKARDLYYSLEEKLGKIIEIPYLPQKGMKICVIDFLEHFGLTEDESNFIGDECYGVVDDIWMHPDYLQIFFKESKD